MFKIVSASVIYILASTVMTYAILDAAYKLAPTATVIAVGCYFLRSIANSVLDSIIDEKLKELKQKGTK